MGASGHGEIRAAGEHARSELRPWRPSMGTASTATDRSRGRGDPGAGARQQAGEARGGAGVEPRGDGRRAPPECRGVDVRAAAVGDSRWRRQEAEPGGF